MARQFNEAGGNTGLIQLCEQNIFGDTGFGNISNDTQRLQQFTNWINEAYSRYVSVAMKSDGKWQFADNNDTSYRIATADLIASQTDYPFLTTMLNILSVEIKNTGGIWYTMGEVDEPDLANDRISMSERFKIPSQPYAFSRFANSIFLLPAPNYSQVASLKVKYQSPPAYFVYGDTTKVPGFAETMHEYLSNYATYKYMAARGIATASVFKAMVDNAEAVEIPELYMKRERDTVKGLYPKARYRR